MEENYFIRCPEERFSELEELMNDYQRDSKLKIQYVFPYIATVAVRIGENGVIEELVGMDYVVEPQNLLRKLDSQNP